MGLMVRTSSGGVTLPLHLPLLSNLGLWRKGGMITTQILVLMGKIVGIMPKLFGGIQRGLVMLRLFVMVVKVSSSLATMIHLGATLEKGPTNSTHRWPSFNFLA